MINRITLERAYREFTDDFQKWAPDGVIPVDIQLLNELGLLSSSCFDECADNSIMNYFQIIETSDKVTLFNDQFAIWIVPQLCSGKSSSLTFIALIHHDKPHLEIVFSTAGVYNSPKYIIKVLQHFLKEVLDNESVISSINESKSI